MKYWTPEEDRTLRQLYAEHSARVIGTVLHRSRLSVKNRVNKLGLHKTGNKGRFKSGHCSYVPPKGTRSSPETEFKKGNRPHTWVPIGTEVLDKEGYVKRKVSDDRDRPSRFNWAYVHRLLWEQHHGPIPRRHKVVFRDGNKTNLTIGNLELVTYKEAMRRNSIRRYPPELAETMQLLGRVRKRINRIEERPAA